MQLPALLMCCASEDIQGNTTAPAADAVWLSVAAVRGPLKELGYQSLAFSPGMSLLDVGKQVCRVRLMTLRT